MLRTGGSLMGRPISCRGMGRAGVYADQESGESVKPVSLQADIYFSRNQRGQKVGPLPAPPFSIGCGVSTQAKRFESCYRCGVFQRPKSIENIFIHAIIATNFWVARLAR